TRHSQSQTVDGPPAVCGLDERGAAGLTCTDPPTRRRRVYFPLSPISPFFFSCCPLDLILVSMPVLAVKMPRGRRAAADKSTAAKGVPHEKTQWPVGAGHRFQSRYRQANRCGSGRAGL